MLIFFCYTLWFFLIFVLYTTNTTYQGSTVSWCSKAKHQVLKFFQAVVFVTVKKFIVFSFTHTNISSFNIIIFKDFKLRVECLSKLNLFHGIKLTMT